MQKITTFLWFNNQAEEAARFYTSIFQNSRIKEITRLSDAPGPQANPSVVTYELDGQEFIAINGGPEFQFTPAISLYVHCQSQEEVDWLWERLSDGGEIEMCGWLKDRFGVSWQIVPDILNQLLSDPDPVKASRVMQAMLQMKKLEIPVLKRAYEQG